MCVYECPDIVLCCLPLYYLCVCVCVTHSGARSHTQSHNQHSPRLPRPLIFLLLFSPPTQYPCNVPLTFSSPPPGASWSILSVSIFMPSIVHLFDISISFVSGNLKCQNQEGWVELITWIRRLAKEFYVTDADLSPSLAFHLTITHLQLYFPPRHDLDRWDQQSHLFARQLRTVGSLQSSWLKFRGPASYPSITMFLVLTGRCCGCLASFLVWVMRGRGDATLTKG